MRKKIKKFLLSLGLGAALMFGATAAVSAAAIGEFTAPSADNRILLEDNKEHTQAGASLATPKNVVQTDATTTSVTFKWDRVSKATSYSIYIIQGSGYKHIGTTKTTACRINGLGPGRAYSMIIYAQNKTDSSLYSANIKCYTLHEGTKVTSLKTYDNGYFRFYVTTPSYVNSVAGYRVTYTNYATKKSTARYYSNKSNFYFNFKPGNNAFYKIQINPYIVRSGKKFVSPTGATKYVAQQPALSVKSATKNSVTMSWKNVAGATSYSVYVKAPGSSSFKKVKTTSSTSYKLTNVKTNKYYYIKVIANKGSAHSPSYHYAQIRLR